MFIVELNYEVRLEKVNEYLEEHIEYLKKQYSEGVFIASGRKTPRTGGVIMSKIKSKNKLLAILNEDPFKINNIANYRIIEFNPSMTSKEFEILKE